MRVIGPALAGVLIGWAWFGVGGVFLMPAVTSFLSGVVLVGLSRAPLVVAHRSLLAEMVDARATSGRTEVSGWSR